MEKISYYKKYLILVFCLLLLAASTIAFFKLNNEKTEVEDNFVANNEIITKEVNEVAKQEEVKLYFDIKGSVKKPGVYEFTQGDRIIDAINKAGGLTKNATTNNLNLSKKLTNEMVIYVFSKNELTTTKAFEQVKNIAECKCETIEVNNCVDKNTTNESTNNETTKININTDSKEKLMTISGIGSSKADAIIEYRTKNGNFKTTEDIINVSGISKTIYDKIKDTITV